MGSTRAATRGRSGPSIWIARETRTSTPPRPARPVMPNHTDPSPAEHAPAEDGSGDSTRRGRLFRRHPRMWAVPLLAIAALACLVPGVFVPILHFDELFGNTDVSVFQGILAFARSGDVLLALVLVGFSVLFPAAKVCAVLWVWFASEPGDGRRQLVGWLEVLGKWSMLDAFVSAVLLGAVQLGILVEVQVLAGIYLYLAAILLSLVATFLLSSLPELHPETQRRAPDRTPIVLTLAAGVLHALGLFQPMLEVEAGWFWENRYSFVGGLQALAESGDILLAVVLALFVAILPLVRCVALLVWRWRRTRSGLVVRRLALLDRWSMGDVFVLAFLVMLSKVGKLAEAEPLQGLWMLALAGVLSVVDTVGIQRRFE
jgi:paraquat-inducible protein A